MTQMSLRFRLVLFGTWEVSEKKAACIDMIVGASSPVAVTHFNIFKAASTAAARSVAEFLEPWGLQNLIKSESGAGTKAAAVQNKALQMAAASAVARLNPSSILKEGP